MSLKCQTHTSSGCESERAPNAALHFRVTFDWAWDARLKLGSRGRDCAESTPADPTVSIRYISQKGAKVRGWDGAGRLGLAG